MNSQNHKIHQQDCSQQSQQSSEQKKQQNRQIWMKNSGYLYDTLVVHKMAWPSLTVVWLPTYIYKQDYIQYQIITATHKSGALQTNAQQNNFHTKTQYIYILSAQLPKGSNIEDPNSVLKPAKIHIKQKFTNKYQCNRARYCQKNPQIIAVRVDDAPIYIYKRGSQKQVLILQDCEFGQGFGLQWSQYGLLSCDQNGNIAFWKDVQNKPQKYQYQSQSQQGGVQDIKSLSEDNFITVGDDGMICFWDNRTGKVQTKIIGSNNKQLKQLYTLAINPVNKNLFLTAGEQSIIRLWDIRNLSLKLHNFQSHSKQVVSVQWSPQSPTIFASGARDSKVKIWDLARVGFQVPHDNNGTEQLLFTHQGHQDDILDIGWNKYYMLLASTEQKYNTLQIYQISSCIQELEYAEDMEYLKQQCLS